MPIRVVSDGLDYAIQRILARYGLDGLPLAANHLAPAEPPRQRRRRHLRLARR